MTSAHTASPFEGARTSARDDAAWLLGLVLACWAALALGAALGPRFDYNLWDNFEYFTPILGYAHGLWLDGIVPLWNPHQHLGEPVLAAGQPGVLYFPYTLGVLVVRVLELEPTQLMLVIVLIHLPLAAVGWFLLARLHGVRPALAAVAALSASLGGFLTALSTVWIFVLPVFAWLPWILYGVVRQLCDPGWAGAVAIVVGLVATACVGYPQLLVYQALTAGIFLAAFGLLVCWKPARLAGVLGLIALAGVLSLPALLPATDLLPLSVRALPFPIDEFTLRGVAPLTLVGWLLPVFAAPNGFLPDHASIVGHQGAWIVPGLVAGLLCLRSSLRSPLGRAFCASGLTAALLLVLAGGDNPLYRATHAIPIWSSLRWPFKLFLMSQGVLVLVAALGLELWTRRLAGARLLRGAPVVLFAVAAAVALELVAVAPDSGRAVIAGLVGAAATLAALPWLERRWAPVLFAAGAFVSAASLTAEAHDMSMKTYPERYGSTGARELGLRTDARVLPLTGQDPGNPQMESLALLHSATANGYLSATGTSAGLIPTWYVETLPCDVLGVPPREALPLLLGSHLLRSFNVGYLVLAAYDEAARKLAEQRGARFVRANRGALVYEVPGVLPRAYFASRTYPYDRERFRRGMLRNEAPVDAAFVAGWTGPEAQPAGRVMAATWGVTRMTLEVDAPLGGFLVVGVSDFPGWSARVDGVPSPLARVNGRVMGLALPRGALRVELELHSRGLRRGLWAAAGGLLVATVLAVLRQRRSRWPRPGTKFTSTRMPSGSSNSTE